MKIDIPGGRLCNRCHEKLQLTVHREHVPAASGRSHGFLDETQRATERSGGELGEYRSSLISVRPSKFVNLACGKEMSQNGRIIRTEAKPTADLTGHVL